MEETDKKPPMPTWFDYALGFPLCMLATAMAPLVVPYSCWWKSMLYGAVIGLTYSLAYFRGASRATNGR